MWTLFISQKKVNGFSKKNLHEEDNFELTKPSDIRTKIGQATTQFVLLKT